MSQEQQQPLPEIKNIEEAIECMRGILSGDNQKIKLGTKIMKQFTKKTESIAIFTYILANCNDQSLRHLSGILLKRNMVINFENLNADAQKDLQRILLERFFLETQQSVRKYIGILVGVVAKLTLSEGKWEELYSTIQQQIDASNQNLQMRIYGIQLLELVLEYSSHSLKNLYKNFLPFFSSSLQDQNKQIRIGAVRCLVNIFEDIHEMKQEELTQYKQLINPILQVLESLIEEKDEDLIFYCFDALNLLIENKKTILDTHLVPIVEYLCSQKVLFNPHLSKRIKETALDLIYSATEFHKSVWNKNIPALKALIKTICHIVTLPIQQKEVLQEGEEPIQDIALWLLQTFTLNLNKKKTFGIILEEITTFIHSNEPNKMNSGFLILAQLAEGCYEQIARNLQNPIMNDFMPKGLSHPAPEVRGAAIKSLTYFADYLPVDICKYHQVIVPAVLGCFTDLDDIKVREKAVIALDIFCDNLEAEDLLIYLQSVVEKLSFILTSSQNATPLMKRVSISALASCISTVEHKFGPYVHQVGNLLHYIILNSQDIPLKSEAINCLGKIAGAFVKEDRKVYDSYVQPCVEIVYQNLLQADDFELREGCFAFFYNLANAIGNEFEPIFDKIIEFTLKQAASEEGLYLDGKKKGDFSLDSDSESGNDNLLDEGDDHGHQGHLNVKTSFIMEKSAAITALGQFAVACPMKYAPYYERALEICEQNFNYFNENVRQQVSKCYKDLCIGMVMTSNNGKLPTYEKGLPVKVRFQEKIENVIQIDIFQKFLYYLNEEEDPEVTAMAIEMLIEVFKKLGPASFDKNLDDLTLSIINLLENKDENSDDSQKELEGYVIEAVCDLIPILCKVLGDSFALHFQKIYPKMLVYLREDRELNENVYMVGCFAQIFKYTPNFLSFIKDSILPVLFEKITLQDDDMNRNLAFCIGNMVEKGLQYVQNFLPQICGILKNIFANSIELAAKDNAAAALCRVMMTVPSQFPLDQALEQILAIVPLKGDEEEEKTIVQTLLFLCNNYSNIVLTKINKILEVFVDALGGIKKYKINQDMQAQVVQFLQSAVNSNEGYKSLVQQLVLAHPEKDKIVQLLS